MTLGRVPLLVAPGRCPLLALVAAWSVGVGALVALPAPV
jgi:hypothetical protein